MSWYCNHCKKFAEVYVIKSIVTDHWVYYKPDEEDFDDEDKGFMGNVKQSTMEPEHVGPFCAHCSCGNVEWKGGEE